MRAVVGSELFDVFRVPVVDGTHLLVARTISIAHTLNPLSTVQGFMTYGPTLPMSAPYEQGRSFEPSGSRCEGRTTTVERRRRRNNAPALRLPLSNLMELVSASTSMSGRESAGEWQ